MNNIEMLIAADPFLQALSNWMQEWDYDGWKEAVLWPEDETTNFLAMARSLQRSLKEEGAGIWVKVTEDDGWSWDG